MFLRKTLGSARRALYRGSSEMVGSMEAAGCVPPAEQDFLVPDIDPHALKRSISDALGVRYLVPWEQAQVRAQAQAQGSSRPAALWPLHGIVYGRNNRMLLAARTSLLHSTHALGVHFLLHPASPWSYVSTTTLQALGLEPHTRFEDDPVPLLIHGIKVHVNLSPKGSHFEDINIAGTDFLHAAGAQLHVDFSKRLFSITSADIQPLAADMG